MRIAAVGLLLFATTCCAQDAPPAAPGAPTLQATTPQSTLTWTDNSSNETGFLIEQKCGSQTAFAEVGRVATNVTTYVATLDPAMGGQVCTFRVAAFNAAGNSAYSNEDSCTVPAQTLAAPTNLKAGAPAAQ